MCANARAASGSALGLFPEMATCADDNGAFNLADFYTSPTDGRGIRLTTDR